VTVSGPVYAFVPTAQEFRSVIVRDRFFDFRLFLLGAPTRRM
jgi:hypothetical protein